MRQPATTILQATCRAIILSVFIIGGWGCGGGVPPMPDVEKTTWCCGEESNPCAVRATLKNGTLRVFGNGAMRSYLWNYRFAPWRIDSSSLSIADIVIEKGVHHIGDRAFTDMLSLKSVTLHADVSSIGRDAFEGCDSLISIAVAAQNTCYRSKNGVLFDKTGHLLIWCPKNNPLGAYTIPNQVEDVGSNAFKECYNLTTVRFSNRTKTIWNNAFDGCVNLKSVKIPSNVERIGTRAFVHSGLRFVTIESGVKVIEEGAFSGCDVISVTIPGSVTSIGSMAFGACLNLSSVTIEEGVTAIGEGAFYFTNLTSVVIPNSVISIGKGAFKNCANLTSVIIPISVISIEKRAFYGCDNLAYITCLNPIPPDISEKPFDGLPPGACLYVPKNCVTAYRNAPEWEIFKVIKEIL